MKKICIVIPWEYPVPAVKGGAVETLVQFIVEENEKMPSFEFSLLTTYDERAEELSRQFKYTKYVGFNSNRYLDKPWELLFRVIKKVFGIYIPPSPRMIKVYDYIKRNAKQYDYILLECGPTYILPRLARIFPKEKILGHLHWAGDGRKKLDDNLGYLLPVSNYVATRWIAKTGRTADKIKVWLNCHNDNSFSKEVNETEIAALRSELGIKKNEIPIIFTGRIISLKGILELIQALQQIKTSNVVLIMIGKANFGQGTTTAFERQIEEEIRKSKVRILPLGFVKNEDLYKYYRMARIAIIPSLRDESAPMVAIESMSMGLPIITTRVGGIPEYIGNAGSLLVVNENFVDNLANEIDRLLADEQLLIEYGRKAKDRARQFTRRKYFERFMEIIDEIEHRE